MTTPVLNRVDLDAEPVSIAYRANRRADRKLRRYDGTDAPPEYDDSAVPAGNGGLDEAALDEGRRRLASVLGW